MKFFPFDHNWQEKRGSALDRAKRLVSAPDSSTKAISKLTGISYQIVANYRQKPDMLDNATWKKVDALGRAYDYFEITKAMTGQDMLKVQGQLHEAFADLYDAHAEDPDQVRLLAAMEKIIASDPVALCEIFKAVHTE